MTLNRIKNIFLLLLILPFLSLSGYASDYIIPPHSKTEEKIISLLNGETFKPFLIHLNEKIFLRDKDNQYISKKMCSHGSNVIEAWKKFKLPKPSEFIFNNHQWKNMLARKGLFTFNSDFHTLPKKSLSRN